jgi:hypothetical protein
MIAQCPHCESHKVGFANQTDLHLAMLTCTECRYRFDLELAARLLDDAEITRPDGLVTMVSIVDDDILRRIAQVKTLLGGKKHNITIREVISQSLKNYQQYLKQ